MLIINRKNSKKVNFENIERNEDEILLRQYADPFYSNNRKNGGPYSLSDVTMSISFETLKILETTKSNNTNVINYINESITPTQPISYEQYEESFTNQQIANEKKDNVTQTNRKEQTSQLSTNERQHKIKKGLFKFSWTNKNPNLKWTKDSYCQIKWNERENLISSFDEVKSNNSQHVSNKIMIDKNLLDKTHVENSDKSELFSFTDITKAVTNVKSQLSGNDENQLVDNELKDSNKLSSIDKQDISNDILEYAKHHGYKNKETK